jgi:Protein of unknown function (DUF1439)
VLDAAAGARPGRSANRAAGAAACRALACLALLGLAACATLLRPQSIDVSLAQLEQQIARQFPYRNRFLELLDVTVSAPRLTLLPEQNRIATELDVSAGERLSRRAWQGTLALNYRLRFEPADHTVRLADVRVERFAIDGVPPALQPKVNALGALLTEALLKDQPVHALSAEHVRRLQATRSVVGEPRVTSRGVSIAFDPAP